MLLKKLKDFHERTMEQYKEEENLEPWRVNFPLEVLCIFIPARENILEAVVS